MSTPTRQAGVELRTDKSSVRAILRVPHSSMSQDQGQIGEKYRVLDRIAKRTRREEPQVLILYCIRIGRHIELADSRSGIRNQRPEYRLKLSENRLREHSIVQTAVLRQTSD